MGKTMTTAVLAAAVAGTAFALPGDLVVLSSRLVAGDEAAGLYYLGSCAAGQLYNGEGGSLARVAPYRVLDRDARAKDYYLVYADEAATPAAWAGLGVAIGMGKGEFLIGLTRGAGVAALRAVDSRVELRRLGPVTRREGAPAAAERPPTEKDPHIADAVNSITEQEYAGYIGKLEGFGTRFALTPGCEAASDYIKTFLADQYLDAAVFPFVCSEYGRADYPTPGDNVYLSSWHGNIRRGQSGGSYWDSVWPGDEPQWTSYAASWLDGDTGFVALEGGRGVKTTDGGDSWTDFRYCYPPGGYAYDAYACDFLTPALGWVGGYYHLPYSQGGSSTKGFLYKTTDGGASWTESYVPSLFRPGTVAFYDADHGWVTNIYTNFNPTFLYTADGGVNWQAGTDPWGMVNIVDLAPTGPSAAWAVNPGYGGFVRTTDGVTWTSFPGSFGDCRGVEFPTPQRGYVLANKLWRTDDGGGSWYELAATPPYEFDYASFASAEAGVLADFTGEHCYRTDDGGASWTDVSAGAALESDNVIGERLGTEKPEEVVIIGGHYDSYSDQRPFDCPGAEDNASGTAVAMAAARAFRNATFKRTVRFVAFGGEEYGMLGSAAYANYCAQQGENVVAVLNADMVSYDEENGAWDDLSVTCDGRKYAWLLDYLKAVGGLYDNHLVYEHYEFYGSDQAPFWDVGYPAVGVIEGGVGKGGVTDYPYYHTADDLLVNIQPSFGVRFARDFAATMAHLAGLGPFAFQPGPKTTPPVVPRPRAFAVYPNPYYVARGEGVHFVGLAAPVEVAVYDLAGRRVARWEVPAGVNECCWRPNAAGEDLAAGVYLYRVEGQGQREAGKLAVVR
jgi:photosystem II stability/assembly factor-like uncharacterized protein